MYNISCCCGHALTTAQLAEARKRGIPTFLLDPSKRLYQLGTGSNSRWLSSTSNDNDSAIGVMFARDKSKTRELLMKMGLPVPKEVRIPIDASDKQIMQVVQSVGFPCVLKPHDTDQGRGATAAIEDYDELLRALQSARKHTRSYLLLQSHIEGHDHRLNVVNGRLSFVIRRSLPVLVGNGHDTVQSLLASFNMERQRQAQTDDISKEISQDDPELVDRLHKQRLLFSSVLEFGRSIKLRGIANASAGGIYQELGLDLVHPRIRHQCEAIALTLRLDVCGIDYITQDISEDPDSHPGAFIEANSMPQNSPKRISMLLDNLFRDSPTAHVPCLVLMAEWYEEGRDMWEKKLDAILTTRPQAVIAIPRDLESVAIPLLAQRWVGRIHLFQHPREPLLDKSAKEVIYLVTPRLVMAKGLPGVIHQELIPLGYTPASYLDLSWKPFLDEYCRWAEPFHHTLEQPQNS